MDGVIAAASRRARPAAAKPKPIGVRAASKGAGAAPSIARAPWSDRAVFTCLKALFFLLPLTMLNLTGLGLDQYAFDPFDTAKMFVFRALLLLALGIWVWSLCMNGGTIRRTKFDWWVLGFVGWAALSTAFSVHPATSLFGRYARYEGLATYCGYGVLFFLSVQVLSEEGRVRSMARAICVSGLLVGLYGVMQATGHDPKLKGVHRPAPEGRRRRGADAKKVGAPRSRLGNIRLDRAPPSPGRSRSGGAGQ